MQHRMKTHTMTHEQVENLLHTTATASLATLNADGSPYNTPVHYLNQDHAVYLHGLPKGQKTDNVTADPRVCMTLYAMDSLLLDADEKPCDTNTKYQSVILSGRAVLLDDPGQKREILSAIVQKYTPHLGGKELPEPMIRGTAVIKIQIEEMTGKYYD